MALATVRDGHLVGLHLLVQGILRQWLTAEEASSFLLGLATLLKVQPISGPHVFPGCAILLIAESHLSVHWQGTPKGIACWVDAFSCKEFNAVEADAWIKERLGFVSVAPSQVLERGPVSL